MSWLSVLGLSGCVSVANPVVSLQVGTMYLKILSVPRKPVNELQKSNQMAGGGTREYARGPANR